MRSPHTFTMVPSLAMVYSRHMDTVVSNAHGSRRGSQDETAPFPLEFEVVARPRKRVVRREGRSQDETAPFPLEFEVVARKAAQSQDETSPFLLEFMVILPDGEPAFVRTARPPRAGSTRIESPRALPLLKWHGVEASRELREYAARIASGESLPPFSGRILASGEFPCVRPSTAPSLRQRALAAPALPVDDSRAFLRFALALMVMTALVVASVVLGDDAQLRSFGRSISSFFNGRADPFEPLPVEPPASPAPPGQH